MIFAPVILLAVAWLATEATGEVIATRLDGSQAVGELSSWSSGRIVLTQQDRQSEIEQAQLLSLKFSPPDQQQPVPPLLVGLTGGSTIPAASFTARDGEAYVAVDERFATGDRKARLPLSRVRWIQLEPFSDRMQKDWTEILQLNLPADLLVVSKGEQARLDYLEGAVSEIGESQVEFLLDQESISVDRGKIAGIIYYRSDVAPDDDARFSVHCVNGVTFQAQRVGWDGRKLQITTAGQQLEIEPERIDWIDSSAGKLVYLSDLSPLTSEWTPLIGLPSAAESAGQAAQPRMDESFYGSLLSLAFPVESGYAFRPRIETYSKGVALRSRSEQVYRVPAEFREFAAVAGIDPEVRQQGHVRLLIEGDGDVLLDSEVGGTDPPLPIELDIAGVRRLRLVVDYGQNWDTGDLLHLCNARFTK